MTLGNQASRSISEKVPAIELQYLRFAVAAADHGSFRGAAERLRVRQSTLSRAIQGFEHLLGVTIFERSPQGIKPTLVGRTTLRIARTILEECETLLITARSNQTGSAGRLAVGFCTSLSAGNLRAALLEFREKFPDVELATAERSPGHLARMLRNGTLDLLIVTENTSLDDCKSLPLWSERIFVTLAKDHKLALREIIYWTDLRAQRVLLPQHDPGPQFAELLQSKLLSPADRPIVEHHDVSRGAIKALVSMGLGISLVLESDLGAIFSSPLYRELRDGTGSTRLGFSAFWRADNENRVLNNFLELLRRRYPSPTVET